MAKGWLEFLWGSFRGGGVWGFKELIFFVHGGNFF